MNSWNCVIFSSTFLSTYVFIYLYSSFSPSNNILTSSTNFFNIGKLLALESVARCTSPRKPINYLSFISTLTLSSNHNFNLSSSYSSSFSGNLYFRILEASTVNFLSGGRSLGFLPHNASY